MSDLGTTLQEKGTAILSNKTLSFGTPVIIDNDFGNFTKLTDFIFENIENHELVVGFCHSLSSYIVVNYHNWTEENVNSMWIMLTNLANNIDFYPAMTYVCEAISYMSIMFRGVYGSILEFLDSQDVKNHAIKPLILSYNESLLPEDFIQHNGEYFIKIMALSYSDAPIETKTNIIDIIRKLNQSLESLYEVEGLNEAIWSHIIDISMNAEKYYDEYVDLCRVCKRLREELDEFFEIENPLIISRLEVLNTIETIDGKIEYYKKLICLLPFMCTGLAENFTNQLLLCVAEFIKAKGVVPKIYKSFEFFKEEDTLPSNVLECVRMLLKEKIIDTDLRDASLLLCSFIMGVSEKYDEYDSSFLNSKICSLITKEDTNKCVIMTAIRKMVPYGEQISYQIGNMLIPHVLDLIETNEQNAKSVLRTIRKAVSCGTNVIISKERIFEFFNKCPIALYPEYFKLIQEMISCELENEKREDMLTSILEFLRFLVNNESSSITVKGYALSAIDMFYDYSDIVMEFLESAFSNAPLLLSAGNVPLFLEVTDFICDTIRFIDNIDDSLSFIQPIFASLLALANGEIKCTDEEKRAAIRKANDIKYTVNKDKEEPNTDFFIPIELLNSFIATSDEYMIVCAIRIISENISEYSQEDVLSAFSISADLSCNKEYNYLNEVLKFARAIVRVTDGDIPLPIMNFALAVSLGRLSCFEGSNLWESASSGFKYYKLMAEFIAHGCDTFVPFLFDIMYYVSASNYRGIKHPLKALVTRDNTTNEQLFDVWCKINSILPKIANLDEAESFVEIILIIYNRMEFAIPVMDIYTSVNKAFKSNCEISAYSEAILTFIAYSKELLIVDHDIVQEIFDQIESFNYDGNYNVILCIILAIFDRHVSQYNLESKIASLFASIVLEDREIIEDNKIECMDGVIESLKAFAANKPRDAKEIISKYNDEPEKHEILLQIFSS